VNSDDQPIFPPGRYGRRRTHRAATRPLVAVLAALLLVVLGYFGFRLYRAYGDQNYSAEVTRFTTGDSAVDIEFIIRLPDGGRAECVVRARNAAGLEIGRATVPVAAGADPTRTVATYRLVTSGKPVTGELAGCGPVPAP
jgi:hypothetical protein